jgi:hypothetical protein
MTPTGRLSGRVNPCRTPGDLIDARRNTRKMARARANDVSKDENSGCRLRGCRSSNVERPNAVYRNRDPIPSPNSINAAIRDS